MSNPSTEKLNTASNQTPTLIRKPYHAPKMENYGAVSALTRSGSGPYSDFDAGYSSIPL